MKSPSLRHGRSAAARRAAVLGVVCAFAAAAAFASAAVAAQGKVRFDVKQKLDGPVSLSCPLVFPSACFPPMAGTETTVDIRLPGRFESIEELCFSLRFEGDLLDPGDNVGIIYEGTNGFGFQNGGETAVDERSICLAAGFHDAELAPFLDGAQTITVFVVQGSVTLSGLRVEVEGSR